MPCGVMADLAPSATCVTIGYDGATNQRVYTVEGAWAPGTCYGQVMVIANEYADLASAAGSASAPESGSSSPVAPQFTPDEVAKLKTQAQVGLTMQIEPKPADPQNIEDMGVLFGLACGALITIWCGKQLLNFISRSAND